MVLLHSSKGEKHKTVSKLLKFYQYNYIDLK